MPGWGFLWGTNWELLEKDDFCFKTYGANYASRNIALTNTWLMGLEERFPLLQQLSNVWELYIE
jgi:hypothetical protein